MFAAQLFTTVLAFLAVGVQATPLFRRDVIVPKITNPKAGAVWPVGSVQTVTWDTSNFPPDSQITNPIGKVILGFDENDSLNLAFEHPLAQNFKLRDGSVKITVPNVPLRTDYLIVLMGDSGNTSPQFAITSISAPGSSASGSSTIDAVVTTSTLITTPIPITGSVITGGTSSDTPSPATDSSAAPLPTSTTPLSSSTTSGSAASSSGTSAASTSGAWSLHAPQRLSFKALSLCMASMIIFIMV
ncbi:hypothetical protein M413DRAFT_14272 [Hebeloma cylindrosporum]|uniref:Yeast cell wall synthesis Kre9/Knh1-like N-terminal domain-containing protein n=1 Tax=Hebeloma cylindrosporum TaxID=76867 RepID=A0A0C2Y486_HEBCY|nr:hypothetical protein M413DRAFT_14272 [Hebeloma cylindrosporum h7]